MRRILLLVTVVLVMAAMMLAMAMPALALHQNPNLETHPLISGECGNKGKCSGFGLAPSHENNTVGDQRNEACEVNGVCIGTFNN
jgi:hypothetical protein